MKTTTTFFSLLVGFALHAQIPTSGLIAHYTMNDPAVISNEVSTSFSGLPTDCISAENRFAESNKALNFNGNSSYIYLNNNVPVITTPHFGISIWANMAGMGGGADSQNPLFLQRDFDASLSSRTAIGLFSSTSSGKAMLIVRNDVNNNVYPNIAVAQPSYGDWHHYVGTMCDDDSIRLYIDGELAGTAAYDQTKDFTTSVDYVTVGSHMNNFGDRGFFNGALDELLIYDRCLDANDVLSIYNESVAELKIEVPNPEISIYPVPSEGKITIQANRLNGPLHYQIFQLNGQLVQSGDLTELEISLNLSHLAKGSYFLTLAESGKITASKQFTLK